MGRYSQMDREELQQEIRKLEEEMTYARRWGNQSHLDVLQQKRLLAKSYLVDTDAVQPGSSYPAEGTDDRFTVEYLNGVMAWGYWESERIKTAVPIGRLMIDQTPCDG
ncbi:hypothetical protein GCM10011571_00580 [Marinithermofilum abyssi]|uniref:DUF1811 family protein n=1 Tax=Marinithermofilum abyssi TaxID=1571185 RepID=A0A8J2YBI0_9BACL|nr:DUF1811 family protein [Marinithermofilum abyssi]GGE03610.1 hypothetical protein GCM10011571_00580 [Marinithermofilum abyssi]